MAHIGHYISGAGHVGLIGFLLVGPLFDSEPLPFEVANVSVVTAEEFAALSERPGPQVSAPAPSAPQEPEVPQEVVVPTPRTDETPPDAATPAAPETPPQPEARPTPPPPPQRVETPQSDVPALITPEALTPDLPEITTRPRPRPADRVAPRPAAPPPPDAQIAEETQQAVTPDQSAAADQPQERQEATAPEEAATEIVTEAETGTAPTTSTRPRSRPRTLRPPSPPAQVAQEQPASSNETPDRSAAVNAALNEALGQSTQDAPASQPSGPPLTSGERAGLVVAVQACWVVDPGNPSSSVVVTVAMDMKRDGTVDGPVRRVSAEGGDGRAQNAAFEAARRAILRCQRGGYDLPAEKYDQWKQIEMTFNPESMRIR